MYISIAICVSPFKNLHRYILSISCTSPSETTLSVYQRAATSASVWQVAGRFCIDAARRARASEDLLTLFFPQEPAYCGASIMVPFSKYSYSIVDLKFAS